MLVDDIEHEDYGHLEKPPINYLQLARPLPNQGQDTAQHHNNRALLRSHTYDWDEAPKTIHVSHNHHLYIPHVG